MNRGLYGFPLAGHAKVTAWDQFVLNPYAYPKPTFNLDFRDTLSRAPYLAATDVNWSNITESQTVVPGALRAEVTATAAVFATKLWPLPAGNIDIVLEMSQPQRDGGMAGLILTDGTTAGAGNQNFALTYVNGSNNNRSNSVYRYTNFGTFQANLVAENEFQWLHYFTRVRLVGAQWSVSWSGNGRLWEPFNNFTPTGTLSHFGFAINKNGLLSYCVTSLRYWRGAMPVDAIGVMRSLLRVSA